MKIFFLLLLIYILYYFFTFYIDKSPKHISEKGFVFYNFSLIDTLLPKQKIQLIKDSVLSMLPLDYVFLDYYYYIKGCSLLTYHRDVTSGMLYNNTKYPTYTVILYEYDGDFISLCPDSHNQYPFIWSKPVNIKGEKNTIVIFNSDILHCGIINNIGKKRKVIQFKVVHKDDYNKFNELNKVAINKEVNNELLLIDQYILKFLSFHFAWVINNIAYPIMMRKEEKGFIKNIQNLIPLSFYNNIKK